MYFILEGVFNVLQIFFKINKINLERIGFRYKFNFFRIIEEFMLLQLNNRYRLVYMLGVVGLIVIKNRCWNLVQLEFQFLEFIFGRDIYSFDFQLVWFGVG